MHLITKIQKQWESWEMNLSVNGCFKNLLYGNIHLTDTILLVPQDLWREKKPRNSIKVIPAKSDTNLIFQLMGVPSRKEVSNCGLCILRRAGPRRRNTEQVFCIQLLVKK